MSNALTDSLVKERAKLVSTVELITERCADEGRDLLDNEKETVTRCRSRVERIDDDLSLLANDWEMAEEVSNKLRTISPANAAPANYRTAGEVLWDVLHQGDPDAHRRYNAAKKRAAEHMGVDKAHTVATAGDLGGLYVTQNYGPVIDPYPKGMPLANAIGLIAADNPMSFMRPRIVDASFTSGGVGLQGGSAPTKDKDELPSKAFEVDAAPVALNTIGGYLNVSQQLISLGANSLDVIIGHLNRRLAYAIDHTIAATVTGTGATAIASPTDAAGLQTALATAVSNYYKATGEFPRWVAMGPEGFKLVAGMSDAAGRGIFSLIGPTNALGQADFSAGINTVGGLSPVLTPGITDAKLYVGGSSVEAYWHRFPILEAVEPSVLGRQVAVAAAVGVYENIADAVQVIGT